MTSRRDFLAALPASLLLLHAARAHAEGAPTAASVWADLPALTTLQGTPLPPDAVVGKVVLVVNVASKCGFTGQYAGLQQLYTAHQARGLVLLGVPCNQFGGQEPGTAEEIQTFCRLSYGVTFPMLEKQDVNGTQRSPLYTRLIGSPAGGGADVRWNFEKFLVSRTGAVLARYPSQTAPDDPKLRAALEAALG